MKTAAAKLGILAMLSIGPVGLGQTTLHTTTTLVVVPTVVQTSNHETVFSLTANDFVLTDNGTPQKVSVEAGVNRPLSLVVLIQTGGIARGQFPNYADLETVLERVLGGAPNRASIVNFDSRPEAASPFTSDLAEWKDAIDHPDQGDSGAAIFDGIAFGMDMLKREPVSNRRAILLISQEHDSGSKVSAKEIVRRLGETNTAIYSMTFSAEKTELRQAFKDAPHLNPPIQTGAGQMQAYFNLSEPLKLVLGGMRKNMSAEMAQLSGGETISFDSRNELQNGLNGMANHIANSYILSFTPTSNAPGLHAIAVRVPSHPEIVVSARGSYWAAEANGETQ